MKSSGLLLVVAVAVSLVCLAHPAGAQSTGGDFVLHGTPAIGGGEAGGGNFALSGQVTPAGGTPSSGGEFTLRGGAIGLYVVPGEVKLTVTRDDRGDAVLTWPADGDGFVLEYTGTLGAEPQWQAVTPSPAGRRYVTPFDQPLRLFRLRRR